DRAVALDLAQRGLLEGGEVDGRRVLKLTTAGRDTTAQLFARLRRHTRQNDILDRGIWETAYPERIRSRITGDGYQAIHPNGVDWTVTSAWTLGNPRDGYRASSLARPGYEFAIEADISVLVLNVLAGRAEATR